MTRHLHHVTLTTAHSRRSDRSEIGDDALALCGRLVAEALASGARVPIPAVEPPCELAVSVEGRCTLATVYGPGDAPLATIGVATHSRCGARLWRLLHQASGGLPFATDPARCPPEPWCAARLEVGIARWPAAAKWLGDFERCLGWAIALRRLDA